MIDHHETCAMIFGRFNPPTVGHAELFRQFYEYCDRNEIDAAYIFISPTTDNKQNPLSWRYRYNFLSKLFNHYLFSYNPFIKDPFSAVCELGRYGYKRVVMFAGPDRAARFLKFADY